MAGAETTGTEDAGSDGGTLRIRQSRSVIGRSPYQRRVLKGLGLRRIGHVVERPDTPAVRGMIDKIPHLVQIVEDDES